MLSGQDPASPALSCRRYNNDVTRSYAKARAVVRAMPGGASIALYEGRPSIRALLHPVSPPNYAFPLFELHRDGLHSCPAQVGSARYHHRQTIPFQYVDGHYQRAVKRFSLQGKPTKIPYERRPRMAKKGLGYQARKPPSTASEDPVVNPAESEQR